MWLSSIHFVGNGRGGQSNAKYFAFLQVRGISDLYLNHYRPVWYQFVTATFCHANW